MRVRYFVKRFIRVFFSNFLVVLLGVLLVYFTEEEVGFWIGKVI